jgi:hypothetical protein
VWNITAFEKVIGARAKRNERFLIVFQIRVEKIKVIFRLRRPALQL